MSQQELWSDFDEFASMTGFHEGLDLLDRKGEAKWTNTATDIRTGGIHGLRYKVERDQAGNPRIIIQHWVHWPGGAAPPASAKKHGPNIMVFSTATRTAPDGRTEIRPVSAEWMGKTYSDPADLTKVMHFLQETSTAIRENIAKNTEKQPVHDPAAFPHLQRRISQTKRRDEIPNLYDIAQRCDFKVPFTLEGMHFNGEFNFGNPVKATKAPAYPLQLLRAMLGIEAQTVQKDNKPFNHSFTVRNSAAGGYEGVTYYFTPDAAGGKFEISCKIWSTKKDGSRSESTLYKAAFRSDPAGSNMYRLDALEMLGRTPDITDHKGVARAIRAMKYIHLAIQRGDSPAISDIIHEHDLKFFLARPAAPQATAANPRISVQVFGANTDAAFTRREMSIGSNGMIMMRDFIKNGKWVRQGVGVDWGVTFADGKDDYYHTISQNYGRYITHPNAPHIEPFVNTIVNLETHEHEDHLRGIARLVKFGFNLPPLVVNAHTKRVLARMMTEEQIGKEKVDEIMARCHVVTIDRYRKPEKEKEVFRYGDTFIEQSYETIHSPEEKCDKFFPILEIYTKEHPDSRTRVRVGPAGHSAHALMFEVDGVLYSGDYRLDQSVPEHLRTDFDWLAKCKETAAVHVQESTNAARSAVANAPLSTVTENRKALLRLESKNRIFYDTIGSNAIDIESLCRAAGEVRNEHDDKETAPFKYIIFAGQAVRNKYTDLNATGGFKKKMLADYGIETLHLDSEKAQELLKKGRKAPHSYIVVMTGTQDEPLSLTHRVSRDLHEQIKLETGDVVIRGQMPIPGERREAIRNEQNNRYRYDFGCRVYDAKEMAEEGTPIYTSSHASREDYKKVHELTGDLLKLLHHGGPTQLDAMKKFMGEIGARAIVPDKQALYMIDRQNKSVAVIGQTPEERVGFREIRADAEDFAQKGRQQATVLRVKDRWQGDVAAHMYHFEALAEKQMMDRISSAPTSRGANLAGDFNEAAGGDFPLIGVLHPETKRPYSENHKNIRHYIGMDTETTGTDPAVDVHTDASFVAYNPEGARIDSRTLKHALQKYMMPTAGAVIVTKNGEPESLYKGFNLRRYIYEMYKTYREWPQELAKDKHARALFFGYRNGVFDDQITMRMMGTALAAKDMKPMATHGNLQLDVYNLYTAMIAFAPDKTGVARDKDGNTLRTLRTACLENGIEYSDIKSHGSLNDAERVGELLFKFKKDAPDIFEQMLMNCDFSTARRSPMLDHILGQNLHLNDNAPVFGYVDRRDRKCAPRLGALVTIDTLAGKATDAIVMDLAKADTHQLEQLSDARLLELMNDPEGPFSVIKLNNSPCWFPAQFVFRDAKVKAKAVGNMPKTTLQARANALKQMRAGTSDGNFIQRVQNLYPQSALCRAPRAHEASAVAGALPASKSFRLPAERIFSLFHILKSVNQIKSKHYKRAAKLLSDIQPGEGEFKRGFHKESFWKDALHRARTLSEETQGRDMYLEDLRFLIEWQVYDINPKWLPPEDRARMNALKSSMLHGPENARTNTAEKFVKELERIESNPAEFEKLVGTGDEAQKRWTGLKAVYLSFVKSMQDNKRFGMTDAKREILRDERKSGPPPQAPANRPRKLRFW